MSDESNNDMWEELKRREEYHKKQPTYPNCPECKNTMSKLYEFLLGHDVEGHSDSRYLFQCEKCKTVSVCVRNRDYGYYFIVSTHEKDMV